MTLDSFTRAGPRTEPRRFPRRLVVLCAGAFVNRVGGFVAAFLLLFLTRHGYGAAEAGVAVALYGAGSVGSSLAGGYLADRVGARAAAVISMILAAATMVTLAAVQRPYDVLLGLCFACGLAADLYRPAAAAMVADAAGPSRLQAFALYRLAVNAGVAVAAIAGGVIADHSFTVLFLADAATCLIFAGVVARLDLGHAVAPVVSAPATRRPWGDPRLLAFAAACGALGVVFFQTYSTLAYHVRASGLPPHDYGLLLALNGLVVLLFELPATRLLARVRHERGLAAGALAIGAGMAGTVAVSSPSLLAVAMVVMSAGEIVWSPLALDHVAALAPAEAAGRYQGLAGFAWSIGLLVAPLLGPWLYTTDRFALIATLIGLAAAAATAAAASTGSGLRLRARRASGAPDGAR